MVSDAAVSCNVAPVGIVTDDPNVALNRKFPDVLASKNETPVTTSRFVPAHDDQAGTFDNDNTPLDAAENVAAGRVVTDETLFVPAAPGAPVCNCT
jgi:hypothetical protein